VGCDGGGRGWIKEKGLSNFKLEVICLPYYEDLKPEIVLEQYFLFGRSPDSSFTLNTIKVSNNPSGSTAKPVYMLNREKSILYYYAVQQKYFITKLNISHFTFTKHLTNGRCYSSSTKNISTPQFNPNLITGISDAECSFLIILSKRPESRTG